MYVQADEQFRSTPGDLERYYVRSRDGVMVPLSNVIKVSRETAPQVISHYNLFRSIEINGNAKPGLSSGQAIAAMDTLSQSILPANMGYEWTGLSLEELSAGSQTYLIFGLGVLCLFLILAAQYESLVAPFIILFSVPLALLGALAFTFVRGLPNDIFTQIGLVMLIGLSSKNGILIVEFANQQRALGYSAKEAVIKAAETRLRPILMTSFAFIFGLLPLLFSTGAGALARHSLGTAVVGGMLVSTGLNLFVIPVFYVLFVRDKKPIDNVTPAEQPFEEGEYSVSEVFVDHTVVEAEPEVSGPIGPADESTAENALNPDAGPEPAQQQTGPEKRDKTDPDTSPDDTNDNERA